MNAMPQTSFACRQVLNTKNPARRVPNKEVLGMKRILGGLAVVSALALSLTGCAASNGAGGADDGLIKVGFAQTGSESG